MYLSCVFLYSPSTFTSLRPQSVGLEDLSVLVLDEADRLLEMGFKEEVRGLND